MKIAPSGGQNQFVDATLNCTFFSERKTSDHFFHAALTMTTKDYVEMSAVH